MRFGSGRPLGSDRMMIFSFAPRAWRHAIVAVLVPAGFLACGAARGDGAPVTASAAELRPIVNAVRLSGTVVAARSARVSTAVGGLVERVVVELGDEVEAGDTLVELDHALAQHDVARAEAAIREAEAELADARRRVQIAQRLAPRGNMPQNELDARKAEVRIAAAAVARLRSEAAHQREQLSRHTITAPFAGVVADKATEAGEWVSPGATVVELVAVKDLRVDIPVPQKYYPQLDGGTPVELRFDALPERSFAARPIAMVPVSDPVARTFTLRVRPEEKSIALTPGMSAQASLRLASAERGIVIPRDAIIRYPDGRATVWVIEDDGEETTVAERQVRLGRAFDGRIHVREGLVAGERVVVSGNEALRPAQRVRLVGGPG